MPRSRAFWALVGLLAGVAAVFIADILCGIGGARGGDYVATCCNRGYGSCRGAGGDLRGVAGYSGVWAEDAATATICNAALYRKAIDG